jgi:hypothetical protein
MQSIRRRVPEQQDSDPIHADQADDMHLLHWEPSLESPNDNRYASQYFYRVILSSHPTMYNALALD